MTAETTANLIAFRKRIFETVSTKTIAALSGSPELATRVENSSKGILARDDEYWADSFMPKTGSVDSAVTKSEVVILESIDSLSDDDADLIRDAMDA